MNGPTINKQITNNPIAIYNPNGTVMYSTHTAELDIPALPLAARMVHIIPDLQPHSLLSMGQLCDAGCTVHFDATKVIIKYNGKPVLEGPRSTDTRLWHINTAPPQTPQIIDLPQYANASMCTMLEESKCVKIMSYRYYKSEKGKSC
jgi:hypothetical protein